MKTLPLILGAAALLPNQQTSGQDDPLSKPLALRPDEMKYEALIRAPRDVLSATPLGDPWGNGISVLLNKFPANYEIPPHKHAEWRIMSVLEGTLYFAYGDTYDETSLKEYGPGSLIVEPANVYHYFNAGAQGAVLQFIGEAPLTGEFAPSVSERFNGPAGARPR